MMEEKTYSLVEVAGLLDIKLHRLREWINRGYIRPSLPSGRSGSRNFYNKADLYNIKLFECLVNQNIPRTTAQQLLTEATDPEKGSHLMIWTDSEGIFACEAWAKKGKGIDIQVTIDNRYEIIVLVNLRWIRQDILKRLARVDKKL